MKSCCKKWNDYLVIEVFAEYKFRFKEGKITTIMNYNNLKVDYLNLIFIYN